MNAEKILSVFNENNSNVDQRLTADRTQTDNVCECPKSTVPPGHYWASVVKAEYDWHVPEVVWTFEIIESAFAGRTLQLHQAAKKKASQQFTRLAHDFGFECNLEEYYLGFERSTFSGSIARIEVKRDGSVGLVKPLSKIRAQLVKADEDASYCQTCIDEATKELNNARAKRLKLTQLLSYYQEVEARRD